MLGGMLIWLLLILWVLVLLLTLFVGLIGWNKLVLIGIFLWGVLVLLLLLRLVLFFDKWFTPHFSVVARFRVGAWMADVACPIACQPLWPACWLDTPDRPFSSSSRIVQDVWDVGKDVLGVVPDDVVLAFKDAVSRFAVNDFWSFWNKNAEASLFKAYALAGGPTAAGSSAFLENGLLRIRSGRLGGRAVGCTGSSRLYRVCQGGGVDKHCARFFVNSSLSPV